jgi:hypothetical protein
MLGLTDTDTLREPNRFYYHAQHCSFSIARTLLLKLVRTKAATTTMETAILTVVETVEVMMNVCILMINAREMKSRIMS